MDGILVLARPKKQAHPGVVDEVIRIEPHPRRGGLGQLALLARRRVARHAIDNWGILTGECALAAAAEAGVAGKEVTPWLLARIEAATGGESLAANRALILDNARVGAGLAVELARSGRSRSRLRCQPSRS